MAKYDPQRTRPTPAATDGPAPVDGLLDSAAAAASGPDAVPTDAVPTETVSAPTETVPTEAAVSAVDRASIPSTAATAAAPPEIFDGDLLDHVHGDECDHGGVAIAPILAGIAAAGAAIAWVVRRRRRSNDD